MKTDQSAEHKTLDHEQRYEANEMLAILVNQMLTAFVQTTNRDNDAKVLE